MYLIEDMVDMGLKSGQDWPTPAHRLVAANIVIGNPMVRDRGTLNEIVQRVVRIPKKTIKSVTFADLPKYGIGLFAGI
jgi:hypothetical protein